MDDHCQRISIATGFLSGGLLVTNGHVFSIPAKTFRVWLRQEGQTLSTEGVCLSPQDFQAKRLVASPAEEYDYAALDIPELIKPATYQFEFAKNPSLQIGHDVAFLGFPLDHQNLTCHTGIVSSLYQRNNTQITQIDASVNSSNSGGPLFDVSNGLVVGIVTRKATGLTPMFSLLRKAIKYEASVLEKSPGGLFLSGMDFRETLLRNRSQILLILDEMERSANVGIGYAFSCEHILAEPLFCERLAIRNP